MLKIVAWWGLRSISEILGLLHSQVAAMSREVAIVVAVAVPPLLGGVLLVVSMFGLGMNPGPSFALTGLAIAFYYAIGIVAARVGEQRLERWRAAAESGIEEWREKAPEREASRAAAREKREARRQEKAEQREQEAEANLEKTEQRQKEREKKSAEKEQRRLERKEQKRVEKEIRRDREAEEKKRQAEIARDQMLVQQARELSRLRETVSKPQGCVRCGNTDFKPVRVRSGAGRAMLLVGLLTLCLFGSGLVLLLLGLFLKDDGYRCKKCGYSWRA